ncbi:L-fuculose-phosphate aldolase [Thiothrix eikelboomii]|uniref:L-fuculose-phosphate aldolase n=1 Tax=Thiothrix eikelboomii TaxID=92487 RepID=A0A1T4XTG2_9GAMM|nr:class II aldolase/adducin family protein [Thiothrix eikelboomii]SKA92832.1 L-fuculose-phosphate aldolase [Thiothrix eikelboomii]
MELEEYQLRQAIIDQCLWMNAQGLNQGSAGNISARYKNQLLITPTAMAYTAMRPEMLAAIPLDGLSPGEWQGSYQPSSEWRFHYDLMRSRPEIGAIVHTHSTYATSLAITRRSIPAVHYMIALFGGNTVRCAEYATYGTQALSDQILKAMEGRKACLLANHGMLVAGETLPKAMWLATELETLAQQYYHALQLGDAVILTEEQMAEVHAKLANYGLGQAEGN